MDPSDKSVVVERNSSWRSLYPFTSHFMQLGPLRYHYLDEGKSSGTREVLLMVHGNPTWSFYWRNLILALRERYRIIAVDHIGCGLSDKPAAYPYTLSQHIDNLLACIDQLGIHSITLFGHDWGGAIGLGAAVRRPELFARFVLFNTGAFPPPRVPRRIAACRIPWLGEWGVRRLNLFAWGALHMATEAPQGLRGAVRDGILAPYDSWENRIGIHRFVCDIPFTRKHPTYAVLDDIERRLPELGRHASQFIWGMRDWCFTPACLERLLPAFPTAEVHRLTDAGHWVVEDAIDRVIPLVQSFLERHPLATLPPEGQKP